MVTVIIPTYKRANNIDKSIKSVLNQTYKNFEIIVVDDNDPDTIYREEMIKIMQKYSNNDKIKYIKHEKNKNGAAARNTGIREAKGEYVTFLDDDDYYMPTRLEEIVKVLDKEKKYNGAYTSTILVKKGKIIGESVADKSGNLKNDLMLNRLSIGTGSNMFFRADALRKIKGFDERFLRHQDLECMIRFLRENEIIGINEFLVIKREDDRSNVPEFYKYQKIKELYINTFKQDVLQLEEKEQSLFYKINIEELISNAIKNKNYKEAMKLNKESKKYQVISKNIRKRKIGNFINFINNYIYINFIIIKIKENKFRKKLPYGVQETIKQLYTEGET